MKIPACLLLALTALSLHAQQPVAYSLTDALARIPLPPATVDEAAALTTSDGGLQLGPALNGLAEELGRETMAISTPAGVADLQDPATIAKLEKMSDAEKIQFAMALQAKAAAAQAARTRPGVVTAADTAFIKRFQAVQTARIQRMQNPAELPQRRATHDPERLQKLEEEHQRIDQEAEAGLAKLGRDGDNIDPAKLRAHEGETWTKHLAAENAYLAERRAEWTAYRDALAPELQSVDTELKASKYGSEASGYMLTLLSQYQILGMEDLHALLQTASQDVIHAAEWQERFKAWQKSG